MSMKIGFDSKRFFHNKRGLGNYSRDLVRILATYAPKNAYYLIGEQKTSMGEAILEYQSVVFSKIKSGFFARQLQQGVWAERLGLDIYHGLSGELPLRWKDGTARKIVTIHDLIFMRYPQWYSFFDRWIHYFKFRHAAKSADRIIAISAQTKADIVRYLKVPNEKVSVVYQGCHDAFKITYTIEQKQALREKYQLPQAFILQVGAVEPRKNALSTIQAIKDSNMHLVLVGKPQKQYYQQIESFVQKNHMQSRIHLLQGLSMQELAILYQMAELLCYPSTFEGFGIPIIEALFSKVPVVTTLGGCFEEAGGKGALYVSSGANAVAEITDAINEILHNPAKKAQMVEEGYAHVQRFTDFNVFTDLMEVYKEVYAIEKKQPNLKIVKKGREAIKRNM